MPNSLFIYTTVYENTTYFTSSFYKLLKLLFKRYRDNFRFKAKTKKLEVTIYIEMMEVQSNIADRGALNELIVICKVILTNR